MQEPDNYGHLTVICEFPSEAWSKSGFNTHG